MGWVEKSGRALELRTARAFEQTGAYRVRQAVPYTDPNIEQQREGDVLAAYAWLRLDQSLYVEAAVECKSGKDHPWVGFYDQVRLMPDAHQYWFISTPQWSVEERGRVVGEWVQSPALATDRVATHIVTALGDDRKNPAQDAVRQAVSFARARSRSPIRYLSGPEENNQPLAAGAVVPVIVTQAPLFTCELDDSGKVLITPVNRFDVWIYEDTRRRVRVGPERTRYRAYVRTEASLEDVAAALRRLSSRLGGVGSERQATAGCRAAKRRTHRGRSGRRWGSDVLPFRHV